MWGLCHAGKGESVKLKFVNGKRKFALCLENDVVRLMRSLRVGRLFITGDTAFKQVGGCCAAGEKRVCAEKSGSVVVGM